MVPIFRSWMSIILSRAPTPINGTPQLPVPVRGNVCARLEIPPIASWAGWQLTGQEIGPAVFQILPQDSLRYRARIYVQGPQGGYVMIGHREQLMNGKGFFLPVCFNIEYDAEASVWCSADGINATFVSVLDERYAQ